MSFELAFLVALGAVVLIVGGYAAIFRLADRKDKNEATAALDEKLEGADSAQSVGALLYDGLQAVPAVLLLEDPEARVKVAKLLASARKIRASHGYERQK